MTHREGEPSLNSLEQTASRYRSEIIAGWEGLYQEKIRRLHEIFQKHLIRGSVLELGCGDGEMTQYLARDHERVVVVDGSQQHLDGVRARIASGPRVEFRRSLFERYRPGEKYDAIVMAHVLEHVADPVGLLNQSRDWLSHGGKVLAAVPNALSIHRRVGVKLGLLSKVDALNEQDRLSGHVRVYSPDLFRSHMRLAGYEELEFGGLMLKPLSNRQIERDWPRELIDAFFEVGFELPELCSEIYVVARAGR